MLRAILTAATLGAAAAFVPAAWHRASPRAAMVRLQMAGTSDFKNGLTIELDGAPCKITEFLHVKPGKGSAFVRTKYKNLITGNAGGCDRCDGGGVWWTLDTIEVKGCCFGMMAGGCGGLALTARREHVPCGRADHDR